MLDELLREFIELDRDAIAKISAGDHRSAVESIAKGIDVQRKLRWMLAKEGHANLDERLKMFAAGGFQLQRLISELNFDDNGPDGSADWSLGWIADEHLNHVLDLEDPEWPDAVNARLLKLDVLFTKHTLPDWVLRHFRAVRRSYALGMYDLVWISLRALIEAGSYEWLVQHNAVRTGRGVGDYAERSIRECLRRVGARGQVSNQQMKQISRIVDRANLMVHAKRNATIPDDAATLDATRAVANYLARLFG